MMTLELQIQAIIILFILFLMLIGLAFTVQFDPYIERRKRRIFLTIILLIASLVAQNYTGFLLDSDGTRPYARTIVAIYGYCVRPVVIVFFGYIVNANKIKHGIWILPMINTVIYLTALFSDICFRIDDDNTFVRGPLGFTCHIVSGVLLAYLLWMTLKEYRFVRRRDFLIPVVNVIVISVSVVIDTVVDYRKYPTTFLTASVTVGTVFYYIWLHFQFVREHEEDFMAQHRIRIMESQMQPHFIYNSLNVISSYLDDPDKAEEALENFTGFLRGSIDLLNSTECIRMEQELKTVKHFLYLEQERYGDKLHIILDIQDRNYELPAFTIQTLVENAVSHGIRGREDGSGTLTIRSLETEAAHVIEVEDDGVGFSVEKVRNSKSNLDGRSHIGIANLKERLRIMCNGTLSIRSTPGVGTIASVKIPKNYVKDENR